MRCAPPLDGAAGITVVDCDCQQPEKVAATAQMNKASRAKSSLFISVLLANNIEHRI
jgi:hypothetical protein